MFRENVSCVFSSRLMLQGRRQTVINNQVYILMGNQNNPELNQAAEQQRSLRKSRNASRKILTSPPESFAMRVADLKDELAQKFERIYKRIQLVKKKENFAGIQDAIKECPIYFLKKLECYYQGQWLNCLPHGYGIVIYKNQSYYEGDFQRGEQKSEEGFYFFNNDPKSKDSQEETNSSYYIGRFQDSKFEGKGKLYHRGITYLGEFKKGQRHGNGNEIYYKKSNELLTRAQGSMIRQSGTNDRTVQNVEKIEVTYSYEGKFENGYKHGDGIYRRKIDEFVYIYKGNFEKGNFNGAGVITVNGNEYMEGHFKNGKLEDQKGILHLEDGKFVGHFINGRVNGNGKFEYNQRDMEAVSGKFNQNVDKQENMKLFCNGKQVAEDKFYTFPILIIEQ